MAAILEIKYFNSFWLKKIVNIVSQPIGSTNGILFNTPASPANLPKYYKPSGSSIVSISVNNNTDWYVEEARIRGGYNNTITDLGVKAYLVEDTQVQQHRANSLIYSGVLNSRTGINNTNQFSVAEEITKSLDPANGSIQKLYAEDTNLIVFQENKVSRALIDKDAIYSAEGAGTLTSSNVVIGQIQGYAGVYGISKDPGSFAVYGYRKYFTDRYRNAVLRLSQDGITEISQYGMIDYFRDEFSNIDATAITGGPGKIVSGWDAYNKQYIISTQTSSTNLNQQFNTLGFNEDANGFTSFYTFKPSQMVSLKGKFYSLNQGKLWKHYNQTANTRCRFYDVNNSASIQFIFNESPSNVKIFKTVSYEGSNGWQVNSFVSDFTGLDYLNPNYIQTQDTTGVLTTPSVFSYIEGSYDDYGNSYPSALYPPINRAGFDRKENKYMATLINSSLPTQGEVSFGNEISGIKGYFVVVNMSIDTDTDPRGAKELFSASTNYDFSVY